MIIHHICIFRFGSQFFISLGEELDSLDSEHLIFGQVVEGLDVINKLNQTLTDEKYRPYQDIRISHVVVLDDPYPDPKELEFPSESPKPTQVIFESDYIAADETIDDTEGKSLTEIQEEIQEKEAKARATILEMVGDLPDAEMAPPENVLFVCKLNPVTTSEDLEIIFSRFGKIKTCEVIRDKVTNNSLQYSFIEFAETKSCEDAYFKMDNVLIDDRRIHVDFSQSVSKIKWRGKGRGVEYFDDDGRKVNERKGRGGFDPNREHNSKRENIQYPREKNRGHPQSHQPQGRRMFNQEHQNLRGGGRRHGYQGSGDRNGSYRGHHDRKSPQRNEFSARRTERNERHDSNKRDYEDLEEEIAMKDDASREKMLKHLKKSLKKKKKKKSKKHSSDSESSVDERKKNKKRKESISDASSVEEVKKKKKRKKRSDSSDTNSEPKRKNKKKKKKKKRHKSSSESSG